MLRVFAVARVDNNVEPHATKGCVRADPVDADMQDIDLLGGEDSSELMQQPRLVVEPGTESEVAARRSETLLERLAEQVRVDVSAADYDTDLLTSDATVKFKDSSERSGAGALGEQLRPLEEHHDRSRDRLVGHGEHVVDVALHDRESPLSGASYGDSVGDRRDGMLDECS